ncbi:MAG TPA: hypothetical protein VMC43_02140 [Candidatus Paceibacterota bacterium]|nr:hypothetical protein [Candidatus Paceibacterota bacterium]
MTELANKNLLVELGLDKLSADEQAKAVLSIGRVVYQAVLFRVMDILDDAKKAELGKLLDAPADEQALLAFLEANVPNIDVLIQEELTKFKDDALLFMKKLG